MLRRVLPWLAFAVLVAVAVVSAGRGSGAGPTPGPARPSPSTSPSASPASLSATRAAVLVRRVALAPTDLPGGLVRDPDSGADRLEDTASLNLCAASYPSEGLRLAARTVSFTGADGRRVRTRVVAYQPGGAQRAVDELRRVAPTCTRAVPPQPVEQPSTLALRVRTSGSLNRAARHELVVERRGDLVVLLDADRFSAGRVLDLARSLSRRLLAALPDA